MVVYVTKQERQFDPMENGTYLAKVLKVEEKKSEKHPEWRPQLQWTFEIVQPPYQKRRAWGRTPSSWFPGKVLDQWLSVMGITSTVGTQLDLDELVGTYVKIFVKTEDGSDFPSVKEVMILSDADKANLQAWSKDTGTIKAAVAPSASAPVTTPAPAPAVSAPKAATTPVATPAASKGRAIPF